MSCPQCKRPRTDEGRDPRNRSQPRGAVEFDSRDDRIFGAENSKPDHETERSTRSSLSGWGSISPAEIPQAIWIGGLRPEGFRGRERDYRRRRGDFVFHERLAGEHLARKCRARDLRSTRQES